MSMLSGAGFEEAVAAYAALEDQFADEAALLEVIHESFLELEKALFEAEGPGWAPLAPSTVAYKARKGLRSEILQATGAMMASFTESDAEGAVFVPLPAGLGAEMGSSLQPERPGRGWEGTALAWFHLTGNPRMPARSPLPDTETAVVAFAEALTEWLAFGEVVA